MGVTLRFNSIVVSVFSKKKIQNPVHEEYLVDLWSKGLYPKRLDFQHFCYLNDKMQGYQSELVKKFVQFLETYKDGSLCPNRCGDVEPLRKYPEYWSREEAIKCASLDDNSDFSFRRSKGIKYDAILSKKARRYTFKILGDDVCIPAFDWSDGKWVLKPEDEARANSRFIYLTRQEYPSNFSLYFDLNCKRAVASLPLDYYIELLHDLAQVVDGEWGYVEDCRNGDILYKFNEPIVDRYFELRRLTDLESEEYHRKNQEKIAAMVNQVLEDRKEGKPKTTYIL